MSKTALFTGSAAVIGAILLFWKFQEIVPSAILFIFGLILIIFRKQEDYIEKRKDKK